MLQYILATWFCLFFFFNDTATTEIYTLSLHDALPIYSPDPLPRDGGGSTSRGRPPAATADAKNAPGDRKSTRLNSSHQIISYAVFCLKKKKNTHRCTDEDTVERHLRRHNV